MEKASRSSSARSFKYVKHVEKPDLENQHKVSFNETELVRRHTGAGSEISKRYEDQVLRCSSKNESFRQNSRSGLMRIKTKSRLMDPPLSEERRSSRMENHSGMLGKGLDIEEDDPFEDLDDLPDKYKNGKISCFNVIQCVCLILIVVALVCSLVIHKLRVQMVWGMRLWKWEVMCLVLICGGLVSEWLIRVVVFFIERNFMLRRRVLYFVYGLRGSLKRFLWLGCLQLAWILILHRRVEEENRIVFSYVTIILTCTIVTTLVWLIKTLLLKVLAINFHVSTFFDRIQDALFDQYVIKMLSGLPYLEPEQVQVKEDNVHVSVNLTESRLGNEGRAFGSGRSTGSGLPNSPSGGKSHRTSFFRNNTSFAKSLSKKKDRRENTGFSVDYLHRLTQKNVSAWNMKRLISIVRKGVLYTLDEHLDPRMEDDKTLQIRSEKEAKAAARRIFHNVAKRDSRHIYLEDLVRFLKEEEASRTMHLFEGIGEGEGISKRALKNWVINVFRERRALALSLNDTKTAIHKLHQLVNILVVILVVVLWLMIFATHLLIFNIELTTLYSAAILDIPTVMHPFDVGDRCEIDGVQMVVEEMNILTTVFLKFDNQKVIYPNSVLGTKPISNYYRSPDMGDAIDFSIHISTSAEKISQMKERILSYIEKKKEHWYPKTMIVMRDMEEMNKLKFSLWLSHTMNYQDMGERWARRSLLVEEMVAIFRDLDIEYRMLPMDVNVKNMPGLVSDRLPSNWTACAR